MDNGFLLALTVGPVQEFIAAARRTRDLWLGSKLLSDICQATALSVHQQQGELIFPHPSIIAPPATSTPTNRAGAVANVILARLAGEADPAEVARVAKNAAYQGWRRYAEELMDDKHLAASVDPLLWQQQKDDVIECYSAWVPLDRSYADARARVMQLLLHGRKSCRNFMAASGVAGIPKSSLDGRRESVLVRHPSSLLKHNVAPSPQFPLADGEELDVVGVVKRAAKGYQAYPSVARVAADPWLRKLEALDPSRLAALNHECARLHEVEALNRVNNHPHYAYFPFDGTAVFPTRYESMAKEAGVSKDDFAALAALLNKITAKNRGLGQPDPYLALIAADGDRLGQAIAKIDSVATHREFSRALAGFALSVESLVHQHQGVCVYAGGDDVLAMVPVDKALACARALRDAFIAATEPVGLATPLTLSVGVAIGHCMEPLEDLLNYARAAEKFAKVGYTDRDTTPGDRADKTRNGLAVSVHPRSGPGVKVREPWQDTANALDKRLNEWAGYFRNNLLPTKLPYDLKQLALAHGALSCAEALQADILLLLKRKQVEKTLRVHLVTKTASIRTTNDVLRLASEMLVAQKIADARVLQPEPSAHTEV